MYVRCLLSSHDKGLTAMMSHQMLALLCLQVPNRYKDGSGTSNGSGKEVSDSQADLENVGESVAGVVQALTELASVQTPASVWLPSKHLTVQLSGKVKQSSSLA